MLRCSGCFGSWQSRRCFGEVFWFGEYGGVNEKQDNMVWAVFLMTVTFLIAGAFAMDHGYI